MKKYLISILLSLFLFSLFGCNKTTLQNMKKEEAKKVTLNIYIASQTQLKDGDRETIELLEEKYLKEKNVDLTLNIKVYSTDDLKTKATLALSVGSDVDAIILHYGEDTGINQYIKDGYGLELDELLEVYGQNILKNLDEGALDTYRLNGKAYAIPSNTNQQYGLLVRKDWLDDAGLEIPTTIEEFTNMLIEFKKRGKNIIPMTGNPWDVERCLSGSFNTYMYGALAVEDGKVIPGFAAKNRDKFLEQLYQWSSQRLWDPENQSRTLESCQNLMITGRSGVFCYSPYAYNLIQVARMVQIEDPDAEFVIINELKGDDGTTKGFMEISPYSSGLMIPKSSENAIEFIKFYDWLLSDKENYELALYGEEGKYWVRDGEDKYGYPSGKELVYSTTPPVSGVLTLLTNYNVSNRTFNMYTEEELSWIKQISETKTYKSDFNFLIPNVVDSAYTTPYNKISMDFMTYVCANAWGGIKSPLSIENDGMTLFDYYRNKLLTEASGYINQMTIYYKQGLIQ